LKTLIKLEEKEAYLFLDDTDIKVIEHELTDLHNSFSRDKRHMTWKYYLDGNSIFLLVYWDDLEVKRFAFKKVL